MTYSQWYSFVYYVVGDIVAYNGKNWLAILPSINLAPQVVLINPPWAEFGDTPTTSYASFYSATTQTLASGAETILTFDAKSIGSADIDISGPTTSEIFVTNAGTYKFLFSIQVDKTSGGNGDFQAWIRVDGNDVPDTNTQIIVSQNIQTLNTCEFIVDIDAGKAIEVVCWSNSSGQRALALPASGTAPVAIPSIIANIYKLAP